MKKLCNYEARQEYLKTAKPILFKTDMVQAILQRQKTVTRRIIKYDSTSQPNSTLDDFIGDADPQLLVGCCPYKIGDILYVRETWCWCPCWDCGMNTENGCCDDIANRFYNDKQKEYGCYGYKASFEAGELPFDKWRPSIFMPKEAARLFLRVTDIRLERLQEITNDGARSEGVFSGKVDPQKYKESLAYRMLAGNLDRARFADLWETTIKPADLSLLGWNANPWVWVIKFELILEE